MRRKIISIITLVMLITQIVFPGIVNATNENKISNDANDSQSTVGSEESDLEIEGNGKIGTLLAEELSQEASNKDSSIYGIVDVKMNNNVALIEYYTKVEATIIVGIYNEEKTKLITSGSVEAIPEAEETYIELPYDEMPKYYYLKAFMVDENNNPLCIPFSTTLYTEGIQKVVQMTADDFEQDRVLNFDNDENTNFAVYSEDTIVINEEESEVELVSVDEESSVYVFENIDDTIRNLQKGKTFVYETTNSGEIVIKVSENLINETKAIITGEKIELEDIFDYIKIENKSGEMETEVEKVEDESIVFEGLKNEDEESNLRSARTFSLNATDKEEKLETTASFTFLDTKIGGENANVKLSGNIDFGFSITTNYYFNIWELDNTYFSIKESVNLSGNLSITGKVEVPALRFANINLKFPKNSKNPLIEMKFQPGIIIEASAKVSCGFSLECTSSQKATTDGITYTSTPIKLNTDNLLKANVNVFIGIDFSPTIEVNMMENGKDVSSISVIFSFRARS